MLCLICMASYDKFMYVAVCLSVRPSVHFSDRLFDCMPVCRRVYLSGQLGLVPVYLPVCLYVSLPECLFLCMPICRPASLFVCWSLCMTVRLPFCLSDCSLVSLYMYSMLICLNAYYPVCLNVFLLFCLSACLSVCLSPVILYDSICMSVRRPGHPVSSAGLNVCCLSVCLPHCLPVCLHALSVCLSPGLSVFAYMSICS